MLAQKNAMLAKVLTSSWSDGRAGPVAFCIPEGRLTASEINAYNMSNYGRSYIMTSSTKSHFMTGEVMACLLEQLYSPAFAQQRARYLVPCI